MTAGRPTSYSKNLGTEICELLITGKSLKQITKEENMPAESTVYLWLVHNPEFSEQYTYAKNAQAIAWEEDLIEISDDDSLDIGFTEDGKPFVKGENIQRAKLRVDTRKWIMGKNAAKKYGDSTNINQRFVDKEGNDLKVTVNISE